MMSMVGCLGLLGSNFIDIARVLCFSFRILLVEFCNRSLRQDIMMYLISKK